MKKKIDWLKIVLLSTTGLSLAAICIIVGIYGGWVNMLQGIAGSLTAFGIVMLFMYLVMKKQKKNEKN